MVLVLALMVLAAVVLATVVLAAVVLATVQWCWPPTLQLISHRGTFCFTALDSHCNSQTFRRSDSYLLMANEEKLSKQLSNVEQL